MNLPGWRSPADPCGVNEPPIAAGDRVRTGCNLHPLYQVIALSEGQAWVRDLQYGTDHFIPIERCRPLPPERQEPPCN